MEVTNCNDTGCEFVRGETNTMTLKFKSAHEATAMTSSLKAKLAGFFMPLPIGPYDVCKELAENNQPCPIAANTEIIYHVYFDVPNLAPVGTRTTLRLQIEDQERRIISCVQVPVVVA